MTSGLPTDAARIMSPGAGALICIPVFAIWFVFDLRFSVESMVAVLVRCAVAMTVVDADRDLPFPYLRFLTHFRWHFLHFQLSRNQD